MRKFIAILGTLLTVMILISGSAIAVWVYVVYIDEDKTTYLDNIDGAEDDVYAHLGQNGPPLVLGWVILDLGSGNEMPPNQDFTVFAYSTVLEYYRVYIWTGQGIDPWYPEDGWLEDDLTDHDFTTPSTSGKEWRYIKLVGISGICDLGDPIFGPEIDAVGWNKP